ncbi:2,4'-dihydroxyacetophenone dioxygenase family protein [Brevibacillus sp. NRS-1366]|uniref:2,4'-dihydroxyacetophenone dioxygenase family protein n=1 Tax=Brevibacillus sp. NRS-1366 TaxID=3233899 RepID=UPI003D1C476C
MSVHSGQTLDANHVDTNSLPWFPYAEGVHMQLVKANPVSGEFIVMFRAKPGSSLGIHCHHGTVIAYNLQGHWRYTEHDWVAGPGSVIYEPANSVHTFVAEPGDDDIVIFIIINGVIEFRDDQGNMIFIETWKTMQERYLAFCNEQGIEPVDVTKF